jgi:HEAT repeat protein
MSFRSRLNLLRVSFAIVLVAVLAGFAWLVLRPSEPEYQGRTLTSWLDQYELSSGTDEHPTLSSLTPEQEREAYQSALRQESDAKMAIQNIGTNAVPILLTWVSVHDSQLKSNVMVLTRRLLPFVPHSSGEYHDKALVGFHLLGPLGKDAVPSLIKLLNSPYKDVRETAADGLGDIGPEAKAAVPFFVSLLNDSNRIVRWDAAINLGRIHSLPDLVVPALMKNLNPLNSSASSAIIMTLGEFGPDAKPAVPALLPFLNNMDQYVRYRTTNALKQIDPEAAAKAGIK